jgi:GntR family transcriptional regulator
MKNFSYFLSHSVYMISIMETKQDNSAEKYVDLPLYEQIKHKILLALEQGLWKSGNLIPSESDLATSYEVSQGTIRKALDELVQQQLLIRRQGSGTFVATHQEEQSKYRFLHLANSAGVIEDSQNKILLCTHQKAPKIVYLPFKMQAEDIFVHIRRLMSFNGKPIVFEDIWLPCPLFGDISLELLASWSGSMYGLFESHFGVHMTHAEERIHAVLPSDMAAEYLGIDALVPVLDIFRVAYTYGNRPVEVRQAQYITTEHHYFNRIS